MNISALILCLAVLSGVAILNLSYNDMFASAINQNSDAPSSHQAQGLQKMTFNLNRVVAEYQNTQQSDKADSLNYLILLAQERQSSMEELIASNPQDALLVAMSDDERQSLPIQIQEFIEKRVTLEGTLDHLHSDDFDNNISNHYYYLQTGSNQVSLYFAGDSPLVMTGSLVKVSALKLGSVAAVPKDSDNFQVISAPEITAINQKKTAVILFNFQDNQVQPYTKDHARSVTFTASNSHNSYYQENSFGKQGVTGFTNSTGDVYGWYTLSMSSAGCPWSSAATEAKTKAASDGFSANNYDNIIYAFPSTSGCPGWGWAYIGGKDAWVTGTYSIRVVSHEEGHNYGVHHASSYTCSLSGVPSAIGDSCTLSEYGDPFDVMGSATSYHLNNYHKGRLGWSTAENTKTVTTSGIYDVAQIEKLSPDVQNLRIPKDLDSNGKPTSYYFVEYRQPYGFDSFSPTSPVANGISIRIAPEYNVVKQTWLIDNTPGDNSFSNSALAVGNTFTDPFKNISITTLSKNSTHATVSVNFGPVPCIKANPTITISPSTQNGYAGTSLNYNINIVNKDSSSCPASTFEVSFDPLTSGLTQNIPSYTVSLTPGASNSQSVSVSSSSSQTSGSYSFKETVTNTGSPTYTSSSSAVYQIIVPDTTAPAVTVNVSKNPLPKTGKVSVTGTASDASGISSIVIEIDGKTVKTCTNTTSCTYSWTVSKVSSGSHTVKVTATDKAVPSNTGTASMTVTK